MVRLLLDTSDADIDAGNIGDMTGLHEAAKWGHIRIVQALLDRGANRARLTDQHKSSQDLAEEGGYSGIVRLLQEYFPMPV